MNNNLSGLSKQQLEQLLQIKLNQAKTVPSEVTQNNITNTPENNYSNLGSFIRGATDSATLGFAPKITGAALAPILKFTRPDLFGDQSLSDLYQMGRDTSRQQYQNSANENPVSSLLGSLVGGAGLPFPAKNIKQGIGLGSLYGGVYGVGSSDSGNVGSFNADDAISGLYGAATGGALGGLGTLGANLIAKRLPPSTDNLDTLKLSEKFNIAATLGELTQNPQQLLKEEAALKGRLGSTNQKNLASFKDLQKEKISDAASNLRNKIGNNEFQTKGENAREAISNLQDQALKERNEYRKIYDQAKEGVESISKENFAQFSKNLEEGLLNDVLTKDNVPKAFGEIEALKSIFQNPKQKEINIKQLEAWRQGLNQTYKSALNSGDEKTGFALNKIKNQFDEFLDNSIETALEVGDTNALDKFKQGRKLTAEWYKKYGANNSKNFGKKFIEEMVNRARVGDESLTDEMVVNKIFGTAEIGFKPESAVIVKELKKVLPKNDFDKIKLEGAQKLLSPLIGDNPSAARYNTNLRKFIASNQSLAKELFTKEEIKQLNDLGKISESILTRKKSLINPSGTAEVVLDYLDKKTGTGFLKNLFNKIELDQNKIKQKVLKGEKAPQEPSVIFKSLPAALKPKQQETQTENNNLPTKNTENKIQNTINSLSKEQLQRLLELKQQKNGGNLLDKIAYIESGNNPNAKSKTSSASGLYQFTNATWLDMVKKYGDQYGITPQDKNNPEAQRIMAQKLLDENKEYLSNALNRKPSNGELYLAHFMGPAGAAKLISSNPNQIAARIFPTEARANKSIFFAGNRPRTVEEVYKLITTKV